MSTSTQSTNHEIAARCRAGYDRWAASYDTIDNPLVAQASASIAARASWFSNARVVELGCGTGRNAAVALEAGASRYVGVDASRGMLDVARARVADERARFFEGDITAPGLDLATADIVLVCLVLEHLRDVVPPLATAARALRPAGRLLAVEIHSSLHDSGKRAHFRDGATQIELPSFRHDAGELRAAAARAGFASVETFDRTPEEGALARSEKLSRYRERAVVLELVAEMRER